MSRFADLHPSYDQLRAPFDAALRAEEARRQREFDRVVSEAARDYVRSRKVRTLKPIERKVAKRMRAAFRAQSRAFMGHAAAARRRAEVAEADVPEWPWWLAALDAALDSTEALFRVPVEEGMTAALTKGAAQAAADLTVGISFDLANPRAEAYIRNTAIRFSGEIAATTRARAQAIVSQAVAEGWSYNRTAKELRQLYIGWTTPTPHAHIRDRAELIAVTEMGNAYEHGNYQQAKDVETALGGVEKSWLTVGDARVDLEHCRSNEQQGWIPLEDAFQSGHDVPLAHPGCRCTALYRRAE